jgi:hypothetical protein
MKSNRIAFLVLVVGFTCVLFLPLLPEKESGSPLGEWLLVEGPTLQGDVDGAYDPKAAVILVVSNAGPRSLRYRVEEFRWGAKHSEARGFWDGVLPDQGLLLPGGTAILSASSKSALPPLSELAATWSFTWCEEPTVARSFLDQLEDRLPFAPVPRPDLAAGALRGSHQVQGFEDAFRLRYGYSIRLIATAEPDGSANRSQTVHAEPNRTSVAAGSDR